MEINLNTLLKTMIDSSASDMHISAGSPPAFRINGQMVRSKANPLSPEDTKMLIYSLLTDEQRKRFEENKELDFGFGVRSVARLRANLFMQRGAVTAVFRRVPNEIPTIASVGLPPSMVQLMDKPHGLILITGATGSGKSTTLAALVDHYNQHYKGHIITVEDPIEFTHSHGQCIVNQRELGADSQSFSIALRQVLREDADVIMVGEIRDEATAEAALKAAETGHLVLSTLHTNGAIASINRFVQMFSGDRQHYIRNLLSFTLEAVVSQALCKKADGSGRVMAYEALHMSPAIRNLIRENKMHQVYGHMQVGQDSHDMQTMNQSLAAYVKKGIIKAEEAFIYSTDIEELQKLLGSGIGKAA
jgi:twitching motility protein PilT